jgi:hypothetical protein
MDYNLANFAAGMNDTERAGYDRVAAKARKRSDDSEAVAASVRNARRFDEMSAIAPMLNNPAILTAALQAQKNAQASMPDKLGTTGYMLPDSGQFVESPMYADEKDAARSQQRDLQAERLDAQARERERDRILRESLAAQADATRRDIAGKSYALRETLAQIARGNQVEREADKVAANRSRDLDKNITKYTAALEKAGVPDFSSALQIAESTLNKYKPGELPGAVPNALATNEMQIVRTDMQQAANILLKSRSGAAVTDGEMRRFLTEVAMGAGMSEEALRNGWANVRRTLDAKRKNLTTMLDEEGHGAYLERGGEDYRVKPTSTGATPPAKPAPGKRPAIKILSVED